MQTLPMLLMAAASIAATPALAANSRFDTDDEGWLAEGDSQGPLTWLATGGNPGGQVAIDDRTAGGVTYFVAPAKFLGDQRAALGTDLRFDLMQVYPGGANQFTRPDVLLQGAGLTLAHGFGGSANHPANGSWTAYAVALNPSAWAIGTVSGTAPTAAQFASVLGDLTGLKIRAEFQSGSDVGHLDNVALVPEPATVAMMLAGLGLLGVALRRS